MNTLSSQKRRFENLFNKLMYRKFSRTILDTAPLVRGELPFVALSMVQRSDLYSYLIALKSFAKFVNPERVFVVCDPTITNENRDVLRKHVPHVELGNSDEFRHPDIPVGGCWERLFAISTISRSSYVVQLDSDTLTLNALPEVSSAIVESRGFVLGEESGQQLTCLRDTANKARPWVQSEKVHIQALSEVVMETAGLTNQAYVRGCAGFTGFPASSTYRELILEFSRKMRAKIGARWSDWGTEQVASNYLVANSHATSVLPSPQYTTPNMRNDNTAFLHFIGSMRFISREYEKTSLNVIRELKT